MFHLSYVDTCLHDAKVGDCISMVLQFLPNYFSINNINATLILYYTADK